MCENMYLIDNCVGFFHGFLLPCLELPESDCWFSHFLSLCAQTSDLRRRFWMTRIHPRSLTASLSLKNGGWKTILSYWVQAIFSLAMLNFGRVDFEDDGTYQIAKCQRSYHFHHHLWCSYCISIVIVAPKSFTVFQLVKRDVFTSLVLGQFIYIDETHKKKKETSKS